MFTGQAYGQSAAQQSAQQAVPTGRPPADVAAQQAAQQPPAGPAPGTVGWGDPTTMPDQPLTHGLTEGPGPGPEVLPVGQQDPGLDQLKAAYLRYPTSELRQLIEAWDE